MVMYDYNSNSILAKPIKWQAATIQYSFHNMHKILKPGGSDQKVYVVDNECSRELKDAMRQYTIDFQLAPLHMHRKNAAEQVIRNCNNYFISVLSTIY